ncbi:LapD/MoxY N-terminal periplasmic domain-containing protein [Shewanella sp. UCD-KL21]|uniref:bifunctional diguanylate cyclase/phosphodiesterase n=1 Tax=Shewanella sp. UCD-KL21 TaxID=1917164 RepID=UPI0009706ACA|nr:LapD/MoxY N-terminal periplasmic domain-containing protein [Shewanella sp. UCD-KL21]
MVNKGMSLKLQVFLLISCLSVFSFSFGLYNNISTMKDYLNEQLASHAQGAAHSLGLSISPYMNEQNLVVAETMANVIFDSGYYQLIQFTDIDEVVQFKRTIDFPTLSVPNWFMASFPLQPPIMTSEVSDGWRVAGQLSVQSHVGISYNNLWHHAVTSLTTTFILLIITLLIAYFILKAVLRPLKTIEQQANSASKKRFITNPVIPFTTELKAVVDAMNQMIDNIQRAFKEQTQLAENLAKHAYIDSLTELPNRRTLLKRFESIQSTNTPQKNQFYLGLIVMPSLKSINDKQGYAAGDAYIKLGAHIISKQLNQITEIQLYRVSGSEFAFLSPLTEDAVKLVHKQLIDILVANNTEHDLEDGFAKYTVTCIRANESFSDTLKRLDTQLTTNPYCDKHAELMLSQTDNSHYTREEWAHILTHFTAYFINELKHCNQDDFELKCIALNELFDLLLQPVVDNQQSIMYVESFVGFKFNGESLATLDVFSMADKLGVLLELEQAVTCFIFYKLKHIKKTPIAINISNQAIQSAAFTHWLFNLYQLQQKKLPPLLYEIKESAVILSSASTSSFINKAKELKIDIAIENFGSNLNSLHYIRNLNIDFAKLDPCFVHDIDQADTRFFVQTVTQVCHGIGLKVIAAQLETPAMVGLLSDIHLDGLQGDGLYAVQNLTTLIPVITDRSWSCTLQLSDFCPPSNHEAE